MVAARTIVVAYILAGVGHKRAAEAIAAALQARGQTMVHVVDVLDYLPAWLRWLIPRLYLICVHYLPWLWAISFYLTDRPWIERVTGEFRRWSNRRLAHRFLQWLQQVQPEVLICTHFLPSEIVGPWKIRQLPHLRVWNVVTDYRPHAWWIAPGVDHYFVGLHETQAALEQRGVPAARITVSGIPVSDVFYRAGDRAALRRQYDVHPTRFTLLITSGGFGVGPMERLITTLERSASGLHAVLQLVIVAGSNPRLEGRLKERAARSPFPISVVGFTSAMHELMAMADVIVTKPGGLTVTEALAVGRPLILFSPIWGQETGNAEVLLRRGAAQLLRRPDDLGDIIERWVREPQVFRAVCARSLSVLPHDAATTMISEALHAH